MAAKNGTWELQTPYPPPEPVSRKRKQKVAPKLSAPNQLADATTSPQESANTNGQAAPTIVFNGWAQILLDFRGVSLRDVQLPLSREKVREDESLAEKIGDILDNEIFLLGTRVVYRLNFHPDAHNSDGFEDTDANSWGIMMYLGNNSPKDDEVLFEWNNGKFFLHIKEEVSVARGRAIFIMALLAERLLQRGVAPEAPLE